MLAWVITSTLVIIGGVIALKISKAFRRPSAQGAVDYVAVERHQTYLSNACNEDRHRECSLLADVWGLQQSIRRCHCQCHPFDSAAYERACKLEEKRRLERLSDFREQHSLTMRTRGEWRAWLQAYHDREAAALILYAKRRDLTFQEAVDEALCFGWTDEPVNPTDKSQIFTPRAKGSYWSDYHRSRYTQLVNAGLMTEAGTAVGPHTEAPPRSTSSS